MSTLMATAYATCKGSLLELVIPVGLLLATKRWDSNRSIDQYAHLEEKKKLKKRLLGISCFVTSGTESYCIPMIAVYKTGYQFGV